MFARNLKIGLIALLLAGFTATMAAAGEAREARDRKRYEEDENGRKKDRTSKTRTSAPSPERKRPEVVPGRNHAKVPPRVVATPPGKRGEPNRYHRTRNVEPVRHSGRHVESDRRQRRHGHYGRHTRHLVWVPGRYETRVRKVWVPARMKREKVPAVYGMRTTRFGDRIRFLITAETHRRVLVPGHYRKVKERVFIAGHWVAAHSRR